MQLSMYGAQDCAKFFAENAMPDWNWNEWKRLACVLVEGGEDMDVATILEKIQGTNLEASYTEDFISCIIWFTYF